MLASIKNCDVLLKGPTETPKGGTLESANVAMRRELDLFANVRPVSVPKLGIDWTFFRENTEGDPAGTGVCGDLEIHAQHTGHLVPTPPWIWAASSVMMSPYRLGSTNT